MRRVNGILIVLIVVLIASNITTYLVLSNSKKEALAESANEISALSASLAAYGPDVTTYTVSSNVKPGDRVTMDLLEPKSEASCYVTDQYVTDPSTIEGKIFKIAVNPATPLMSNMFMDEDISQDMRDRDITLDRITVGLTAGDYIDIRMTMPYGDDYIVLSHKRVESIGDNTLKLHLTEEEWLTYQGALIDLYLNQTYGCTIYADRYIEPGIQTAAVRYYSVPNNIYNLLLNDPNVLSEIKQSEKDYQKNRVALEELLVIFRDDEDTVDADASKLVTGRSAFNENVKNDYQTDKEQKEEAAAQATEQVDETTETIDDDFWSDTGDDTEETEAGDNTDGN